MTGWERKENEILETAEQAEGESLGRKRKNKYVIWGFWRQIALQERWYSAHGLHSYSELRTLLELQA